jgi:hypothetical protein
MNSLAESGSALVILFAECLKVPRGRNPHCGVAVLCQDRRSLMHWFAEQSPYRLSLTLREPAEHPTLQSPAFAFALLSATAEAARLSASGGSAICLPTFTSDSATATQDRAGSPRHSPVNSGRRPALARVLRRARVDRSQSDLLLVPEVCRLFATARSTKTHKGI